MSIIKTKQHEWIISNANGIRKQMEKWGCECIFFLNVRKSVWWQIVQSIRAVLYKSYSIIWLMKTLNDIKYHFICKHRC